jgi:tetraacyldisaccharide-1-P 4'-kinase
VESKAREAGAAALVTTAKDAVKLKGLKFTLPCYVALAETIIDDPDAFKSLITSS